VQRARRKKASNKTGRRKILLDCFGLTEQRIVRASFPHWMCYHFPVCSTSPDQVRLSNVQNNNKRSHQAAKGVTR